MMILGKKLYKVKEKSVFYFLKDLCLIQFNLKENKIFVLCKLNVILHVYFSHYSHYVTLHNLHQKKSNI